MHSTFKESGKNKPTFAAIKGMTDFLPHKATRCLQ